MLKDAVIGSKWVTRQGDVVRYLGKTGKVPAPYCYDFVCETPAEEQKRGWNTAKRGDEFSVTAQGSFFSDQSDSWDIVAPVAGVKVEVVDKPVKKTVLHEALEVAGNGAARARDYGHPLDNHERIAALWNTYDRIKKTPGAPDTAADVAMKMILLKVAREQNTPKRDNLVDIAGYTLCVEEILAEAERRAGQ